MNIVLNDGSILSCRKIEIYGNTIVADEYRRVSIFDVERIEESDDVDE